MADEQTKMRRAIEAKHVEGNNLYASGNKSGAAHVYKDLCLNHHHAQSCLRAGNMYAQGDGVDSDKENARSLFRKLVAIEPRDEHRARLAELTEFAETKSQRFEAYSGALELIREPCFARQHIQSCQVLFGLAIKYSTYQSDLQHELEALQEAKKAADKVCKSAIASSALCTRDRKDLNVRLYSNLFKQCEKGSSPHCIDFIAAPIDEVGELASRFSPLATNMCRGDNIAACKWVLAASVDSGVSQGDEYKRRKLGAAQRIVASFIAKCESGDLMACQEIDKVYSQLEEQNLPLSGNHQSIKKRLAELIQNAESKKRIEDERKLREEQIGRIRKQMAKAEEKIAALRSSLPQPQKVYCSEEPQTSELMSCIGAGLTPSGVNQAAIDSCHERIKQRAVMRCQQMQNQAQQAYQQAIANHALQLKYAQDELRDLKMRLRELESGDVGVPKGAKNQERQTGVLQSQ